MAIFTNKIFVLVYYALCMTALVSLTVVYTFKDADKSKQIKNLEADIGMLNNRITELESINKTYTSTIQSCLSSCSSVQLLDVVKESLRIKR